MTETFSALYAGSVMHIRLKPRRHRLAYRIFSLLIDLDELDELHRRMRLFSLNRFNVFSLFERDYGAPNGGPLKLQVDRLLAAAGLPATGGRVRLLTMPRMFGYAFNPLNIYFCHRRDGSLQALLYEVNNTFGERHSYLIPVEAGQIAPVRQKAEKRFYVSPFLDMGLTYSFRIEPPVDTLRIAIQASDDEGPVMNAVHSAARRPFSDGQLALALLCYPLFTLKVIVGIHWEALRIWAKGVALRPRPAAPEASVSISSPHRS
ncbi:MAG: DUF1365 domain-containing protein [Pseudomonadota bacterium]